MALNRLKRRGYRLLDRGSKYFKTDLFYLTKGGFWIGLSRIFFILTGLALSVAFANFLTPETYGTYQFVLSLFGIISAFTLTGMNTAVARATAQGAQNALRVGFQTHLKWSVGVAIVAFVVALYYFLNENNTLAISLLIAGAFAPFLESARLYSAYLTGKKDFKRNTLLGFGRRAIPTISMLIALFFIDSVPVLILIYFASQTITMVSLYLKVSKESPATNDSDSSDLMNYSKHLSVMNFLGRVAINVDRVLIFHFLGAAQLAIYSFAILIPKQLQSLGSTIEALVLPKMSERSLKELKRSIPAKAGWLLLAAIGIVILYIFTAPAIFQILFPQYGNAVVFTQVLILMILFLPNLLFMQALTAHAKTKELYIARTIAPTAKIALLFTLLPLYGTWGAIAALLLSQLIYSGFLLSLFYRVKTG